MRLQKLALHVEANILGHTMMMSKMKAPMIKVVDSTLAHPSLRVTSWFQQLLYDILLNLMDQSSKGFDLMQVLIVSKGLKKVSHLVSKQMSLLADSLDKQGGRYPIVEVR